MKRIISAIISTLLTVSALPFLTSGALDNSGASSVGWYTGLVDYLVSAGIPSKEEQKAFPSDETVTRAMFITMLGHYADIDTAGLPAFGMTIKTKVNVRSQPNTKSEIITMINDSGTPVEVLGLADGWYNIRYVGKTGFVRADLMSATDTRFSDIGYGTEYGGYVRWAHQCGILENLVKDGPQAAFEPDSIINREQICLILYNFTVEADILLPHEDDLIVFTDDSNISKQARDAVYAMQQAGVVGGYQDGRFVPDGSASVAEAAAILSKFIIAAETEGSLPVPSLSDSLKESINYQTFGNVVRESAAVSDSYFNNACFIGHSMVVGMKSYFSLPRAHFFAVNGISAGGILSSSRIPLTTYTLNPETGERVYDVGTIRDALRTKTYRKVYIMLGTNELGPETRHSDAFYNNLCSLVDLVHARQPNATIYLISVLPISKSRSNSSDNFNRENVLEFNRRMMQVAQEKNVYYIDAFSEFADKDGYLPSSACVSDGIHIVSREYARLKTYLKTHTV